MHVSGYHIWLKWGSHLLRTFDVKTNQTKSTIYTLKKLLNLDSSPHKLKNFIENCRRAQLKDSNSMKYFLEIDSLSVGVENAVAKI